MEENVLMAVATQAGRRREDRSHTEGVEKIGLIQKA